MPLSNTVNPRIAPQRCLAGAAGLHALLFHTASFFPWEDSWAHVQDGTVALLMGFSHSLLLLLCLAQMRHVFLFGTPLLFAASAVVAYLRWRAGISIDGNSIGALLDADRMELRTALTWDVLLVLGAGLLIGAGVAASYARACRPSGDPVRTGVQVWALLALPVLLAVSMDIAALDETTLKLDLYWALPMLCLALLLALASPVRLGRGGKIAIWLVPAVFAALVVVYGGEQGNTWIFLATWGLLGAWAISPGQPVRALGLAMMLVPALTGGSDAALVLPSNIVHSVAAQLADRRKLADTAVERLDISQLPGGAEDEADADLVMVVVIGESARGDHFGINRYARPTTPRLSALPGLVSFRKVRSCAAATRVSVPCLLTRATEYDLSAASDETSLISVFRRHGFETNWISTNQYYGDHDTPITRVALEADTRVFPTSLHDMVKGAYDEALLPGFQGALARPGRRKLVLLHQRGSHWHYHDRYPEAFRIYSPTCEGDTSPYLCPVDKLTNGYDNTIIYTDFVLASVIAQLQSRNALFVYVSDHGQSLGEDGFYTHGSPERDEQRLVPMIWWASPRFRAIHGAAWSRLLSHKADDLSHDHVFHSVLGCAGFRGTLIDPSLNLCAPK